LIEQDIRYAKTRWAKELSVLASLNIESGTAHNGGEKNKH